MCKNHSYEVETRLFFQDKDEACRLLPFLKSDLQNEVVWNTGMYGPDLYKSDKILRISEFTRNKVNKVFLGYKDRDIGTFCNIRAEIDEDITHGLNDSLILGIISGDKAFIAPTNAKEVLKANGYDLYMSFTGYNLSGYNELYGLSLKLMACSVLEYPLMLELEKSAKTMEEALTAEQEIQSVISKFELMERVVRKEPTTLLYEAIIKNKGSVSI